MTKVSVSRFILCLVSAAGIFAQAPAPPATAPPAREPGLYITIVTSMGTVVGKFFEKESPITVKNISDLAMGRKQWRHPKTGQMMKTPLYNGLTFHRVIPGFMIQGGDPLGTGTGGTDPIPDEFHPSLRFDRAGRFGMANAGPGTGSCQFFITEVPTPHLDGKHTIFAQVVEGQDVVEKIARTPRNPVNDMPRTPVRILRAAVKREGAPVSAAPVKRPAAPAKKPAAGAKPPASAKKPAASSTKPPQ